MGLIFYIYVTGFLLFILCTIIGSYIERKIDETHSIKKWWRRHIVGDDPEQRRPDDDFNI